MSDIETNLIIKGFDKTQDAFASMGRNLKKAGDAVDDMNKKMETVTNVSKKMLVAGTVAFGAITAVAVKSVQAYAETERAQRQLENSIMGISKGTRAQVTEVENLVNALQKKAGVDADSVKMGVAQLSTFGLQSESVIKLTKSLADLTVNQSGLDAGSEDYIQSANNIAKALNGQFGVLEKSGIRFTEAQQNMILYGTEAEKVSAVQAGLAQNLRETTDTVNGVDLASAKYKRTMEDISENIGKGLVPAFGKLTSTVQPLLDKIAEWTDKNPELTGKIVLVAGAVAGLIAVVGALGLVIGPIVAGFTAIGVVLGAISLPIIAIVALLAVIGGAIYYLYTNWATHWDNIKWAVGIAVEYIGGIIESLKGFFTGAIQALVDFGKYMYETSTPIWLAVNAFKALYVAIDFIGHVLLGLFNLAKPLVAEGIQYIIGLFTSLGEAVMVPISYITQLLSTLVNFVVSMGVSWGQAFQSLIASMAPVVDALMAKFETIKAGISAFVGSAQTVLKSFANFFIGIAEGIGNAWVKMVNTIISALNKIQVSVPDWVPKYGGKSFGINLPQASEVSIPRLAEGGIATKSVLANIGEAGPEAIIPLSKLGQFGGGNLYIKIDTMVGESRFAEQLFNKVIDELKRNGRVA